MPKIIKSQDKTEQSAPAKSDAKTESSEGLASKVKDSALVNSGHKKVIKPIDKSLSLNEAADSEPQGLPEAVTSHKEDDSKLAEQLPELNKEEIEEPEEETPISGEYFVPIARPKSTTSVRSRVVFLLSTLALVGPVIVTSFVMTSRDSYKVSVEPAAQAIVKEETVTSKPDEDKETEDESPATEQADQNQAQQTPGQEADSEVTEQEIRQNLSALVTFDLKTESSGFWIFKSEKINISWDATKLPDASQYTLFMMASANGQPVYNSSSTDFSELESISGEAAFELEKPASDYTIAVCGISFSGLTGGDGCSIETETKKVLQDQQ